MSLFAGKSVLRRSVALILATVLSSGCMTWRPVTGREAYLTARRPEHVRAALVSGATVDLYGPSTVGDQLVGYHRKGVEASRVSIPTSEVKRIDVRRVDGPRTAALIVATSVVVTLAAFVAVAIANYGFRLPVGGL